MARKGGVDRGLFRRDGHWWIRWACSHGHEHMEKIGTAKGVARDFYQKRKLAVKEEAHLWTAVEPLTENGCHSDATLVDSLLESVRNERGGR